MSQINAYSEWLGIPQERLGPEGRPSDYYGLLGLSPEQATVERAHAAAQELFFQIRKYETSAKPGVQELVIQLRTEIAAAEICLTDPDKKRQYDQERFGRTFDVPPTVLQETVAQAAETQETLAEATVAEATVAEATVAEATVAEAPAAEGKETEPKGAEAAVVGEPVRGEAPAESAAPAAAEVIVAELVPEARSRWRSTVARTLKLAAWLLLLPFRLVDRLIGLMAGEENDILRWFLRIMAGAAASLAIVYFGVLPHLPPSRAASKDSMAMAKVGSGGGQGSEGDEESALFEEMTLEEWESWDIWAAMDEATGSESPENGVAKEEASKPGWVRKILPNWLTPKSPSASTPASPEVTKPAWTAGQGPPPLAVAPFNAEQAKEHQRQWAEHLKVDVTFKNSTGMEFVLIPPGEFLMGASDSVLDALPDERPQHRVRITRPFYLGKCEVTWGEYEILMRRFSTKLKSGAKKVPARPREYDPFSGLPNPNFPVESEDWGNASRFCRELSARPDVVTRHYRLPTEAEWEYACRAGSTADAFPDNGMGNLADYAWFSGSAAFAPAGRSIDSPFGAPSFPGFRDMPLPLSSRALRAGIQTSSTKTHPVGQKLPNAFGLHDTYGNVWEMCSDWFAEDYYQESPFENPTGAGKGTHKVARGGAWNSDPAKTVPRNGLQPFHRGGIPPTGSTDFVGFRVACEVPDGTPSQPSPQPPPSEDDPFK